MPAGRKPLPEHLKLIKGTASRAVPLIVDKSVGNCPTHLSAVGKAEWKRVTTLLAPSKVLSALDREALAVYCWTLQQLRSVQAQLDKEGATQQDRFGKIVSHPLMAERNRLALLHERQAANFGLTPVSRRLLDAQHGNTAGPEEDALDKFMAS